MTVCMSLGSLGVYAYSVVFMFGLLEKSCKRGNVAVAVRYENANEVIVL